MIVLFKAMLLGALALLAYLALFQIRARWFQRVLGLVLGVVVATFIIAPDLATHAGNLVGVGRGADLVFYLSHVLGAYFAIRIYQRQIRLEDQLTTLVRALAHFDARTPANAEGRVPSGLRIFSIEPPEEEAGQAGASRVKTRSA